MKNNHSKLKLWAKLALGIGIFLIIGIWLRPYFAGTATLDPVLIQIPPITIHWYGVFLTTAILVCLGLALRFGRLKDQLSADNIIEAGMWSALGGLVGARLIFVILKWPDYANNLAEIFLIQNGGLSIHGAIIGGAVGLYLFTRSRKINFFYLADLFAVTLPLGQFIGRFGNFVNQEAFGGPTDLPWKMFISPANRPAGHEEIAFFHPTFLYEGIGSLMIFYFLARLFQRQPAAGQTLVLYLIMYSGLRFITEFWRIDSDQLYFLSVAQWASLVVIALAVAVWIKKYRIT